ncbi:MAG: hypothetical protein AVDCRST_MAG93-7937 [uncultured Chloroflexia bacterium]|uniref:Fibronectin type-III domain-containing protein n=1 Tax=uncultured Chloroflexia bacterium TaxID=1672391 RepID=A0A6J4MPV7_9CHLR|nr:MAG: hypothetical protein AVDCRST_MAG93-7937 [uncultured Chloroflexia bacterium]
MRLIASGVGEEEEPARANLVITGEALRPPAPVHLRAERTSAGDLNISWVRRSRSGWDWVSEETPLGEETESYRLSLTGPGVSRRVTVNSPSYVYTAAEQAADGLAGKAVETAVVQVGTTGASRPSGIIAP